MNRLCIIGFGPGNIDGMTIAAYKAIEASDIVVGFSTYTKLIQDIFPDKEYVSNGMGGEVERTKNALELAAKGHQVALVCSGDACVYGMAGLAYELSVDYPGVELSTIAGVTAALSGSALLGAAMGNDMCTISLSDYHTSWDNIKKRLIAAAESDFVIALYNPRSKARPDDLKKACEILLEVAGADRVCGLAENIGREGTKIAVMTLDELKDYPANMFTTAFIGNSTSQIIDDKMVTPRGYLN